MEATIDAIEDIINRIPNADFISIDCEFGGIRSNLRTKGVDEHLSELKNDVETYVLLEIGFSLAEHTPTSESRWLLYPYNFYASSSNDTNVTFNKTTIKWLRENGFSFDRWIDEGVEFRRLVGSKQDLSVERKRKAIHADGLHQIMDTIILHRKPLVFHNGILDILHIYDKFIGALPDGPEEISKELARLFVGGIFDTKSIAHYLNKNCEKNALRQTSLPILHAALKNVCDISKLAKIAKERAHMGYINMETGKVNDKLYHEAGFDAMVTAMVFVAELDILQSLDEFPIEKMLKIDENDEKYRGKHIANVVDCFHVHNDSEDIVYNFRKHAKQRQP